MKVNEVLKTGMKYLGAPYVFGSPTNREDQFDCSSFIQHVYRLHGINLPRNSRQQYKAGKLITFKNIMKGDLLFFTTKARKNKIGIKKVGHVAIYIGKGKILHTYREGKKVTISKLNKFWLSRYLGAKRVIDVK